MSDGTRPPGYPHDWEADVVLRDGTVAHLRPILPQDAEPIQEFHSHQSDESIYLRFFAPIRTLSERDLHHFTHVDYSDRVALVVTMRDAIIGIGRYDRVDGGSAEVAFNISDHYQGKGIGSVLLEHLAAIAQEEGIARFVAEVLPRNRKMLAVFSEAGYAVSRHLDDGVVSVSFDIEPTARSTQVRLSREHRAEARSMRAVLFPTSVAVVGASDTPGTLGHALMTHLVDGGYSGRVHAVNPAHDSACGVPCVPTVTALADPVDLAVVAVPAEAVFDVVDDCADHSVKALLVLSSGFAEQDEKGLRRQRDLVSRARGAGMRVVGPNSFGLMNLDPQVALNASLAPRVPRSGRFGLFAQSGALAIALLASAAGRGLGISTFASVGNRADVSGNDFMQYWIDDDATTAVGLYLESMGNPRKFSRIARHLAGTKPVIAVSSGVSAYAVPPGHSVRATRVPAGAFDAMLRQAGVIRVENSHQLLDVAQLVVNQPLPTGDRVAIVSNSDALSSLMAQACHSWDLSLTHGPVSVRPDADAASFRAALVEAAGDPEVDSVLTAFIPAMTTMDEDVAVAVRDAARDCGKPVLATFLGMRGVDHELDYDDPQQPGSARAVPRYPMPEDAVRALAAATRYGQWLAKDKGEVVSPHGLRRREAAAWVDEVLDAHPDGLTLGADQVARLLGFYGITVWPRVGVDGPGAAVEAAEELGYPVVIKSTSPRARHTPGVTGVRVDLGDAAGVRAAFTALQRRLRPLGADQLVVQRMADVGVPCVLSTTEDPLFGPVVSFSVAGPATELLHDISHRIPPLTDVDVEELMSTIKLAPLLQGRHGNAAIDRVAMADLIARVSVLAEDLPEVAWLVLNPVNAREHGVDVLGAEIVLAPGRQRSDGARRTLSPG